VTPTIAKMGGLLADGTGDSIVNERGMNGRGRKGEKGRPARNSQGNAPGRTRMSVGLTRRDRAAPTVSIAS
jgi:hypothetical protein